ncbi:MAG: hypothetical protein LBD12_04035, partial [Clostridiales Family XIII bacterium]|nr:hypothetical protein [Clostridiales Family XIII bacterium]
MNAGADRLFLWGEPSYRAPAPSRRAEFVFYAALLLLGALSALACFYSVFPVPVNVTVVAAVSVLSALGAAVLFLASAQAVRVALLSLAGLCAFLALVFGKGIAGLLAEGGIRVANTVIDAYAASAMVDFDPLPLPDAAAGAEVAT